MADGTPPKPATPRPSGKPPASPLKQSSTHLRPSSSTALPRSGTTARRALAKPEAEAVPQGPVEVVASSDGVEVSQVRRAVASSPRLKGVSLRWKIVIAMAGITVATAVLIFVVVYSKAVSQLNDEIDAKGTRLVNLLASIDADYWMTAIHTQENSREADFQDLITALRGPQNLRTLARTKGKEDVYRRTVEPFGEAREAEVRDLITALLETDKWAKEIQGDGIARRKYERLVRPFSNLAHLRPLQDLRSLDRAKDLLDAGVVDVTGGERDAPGITLKGHVGVTLPSAGGGQGVTVRDIPREERGHRIMSRTFIREPAADAARKLRHYVSLSLEGIEDAKGALRTAIFLPIFVSVLLGTGIAIWISTLITEPIKVLISDMQEVSAGNLEHQTVARSKDEVGMLASTFNRMTQALRAAHQQELEAKALEHDLAIASEIQSNLVPKRMLKVPGYDISAYYRPSKEVGGDYYDFIQIDEDNEGVIVADVSGKGVPGSLVMTMARAFIRMEAERSRNVSPADTLVRANRMLAQDIKKGMFVTALYCILNKRDNEIRVASAGHNPLVVWRAGTGKIELVNPNGIALGFDKGPVFERTIKEDKLVLAPGDRIVAYTDGVVEAMNAQNQEFGDGRFRQLVQQLATRDSNQMLNLLVKTLDEHKGSAPQSDDITIVTLRRL
jgi:serine phosphatase RsbU (regulator of sigma subunit)